MAPSNPLANWERLGDSFYRKVSVYDAIFDEDVDLDNYIVAGAPYGGAIGTLQVLFQSFSMTDEINSPSSGRKQAVHVSRCSYS